MTEAVAALVTERGGSVALERVTLRAPGPGELVVGIGASGVCPTDLFGIDGGAGERFPAVFGHEGAGVVEAVGDGVDLAVGDHVVLGFDSCGSCRACRGGHPSNCSRFAALNYRASVDDLARADGEKVHGGWMAQSSWSTHAITRARGVVAIPRDVPWAVAATLGCGVLTGAGTVLNVLQPGPGDALLVVGAGTTGLAAVMAARHRGARRIIVCEPDPERRRLAVALGATATAAPGDLASAFAGSPEVTHALDTVGTQAALDTALDALAAGGVCATIALKPGDNVLGVAQGRLLWGRRLVGVIEGDAVLSRDVPTLVAMWRAGALPVERLVTTFPFDDAATAVAAARSGDVVKAVLTMPDAPASPGEARRARDDLIRSLVEGVVPDEELAALWRSLPPVETSALRGFWRGRAITRGHRMTRTLETHGWVGKLFAADDDVAPIVCRGDDGALGENTRLARGGARLIVVDHDGVRTAAMSYDALPVIDAFVRLSPDALLGVMSGHDTLDGGVPFHFLLERDDDPPTVERARGTA